LARLLANLRANADSAFGRAHGFARIDSVRAYQSAVPVRRFEQLAPWVDRAAAGELRVLTCEPVRMFERTSGSTSANKLVPFTQTLLDEIAAATRPWLFDLYRRCPGLRGTGAYWAISPVTRQAQTTQGGIPIGIDDDREYFCSFARWAIGQMMAAPSSVARIESVDRWRFETCRYLLEAENLGLISVWSPTFASLLLEAIASNLDALLDSIAPRRAQSIRQAIARNGGNITADALWPRLALVSCWTDGPSRGFVAQLRRWFPRTPLQPKGLLATEGVVSFPLWGHDGSVLAVRSHFLEFVDTEYPSKPPLLAHELRDGMIVSPILTTSGGLYRYHLQDRIRIVGRYRNTPCIRFEGRLDCASDLVGEKLDARVVELAVERATQRTGKQWQFAMLAPELGSPPAYRLYLEGPGSVDEAQAMAAEVESALAQGAHYAYCRKLGQLGPVRSVQVRRAAWALERRQAAEGGRIGELKPTPLDRRAGWAEFFA
ncbi:MAG: GH3 auxin-responsive promoter family protein, partial [Polyangiaceae bacterium]|nr:GH3 auxin-responsive promoter family protein [Polyangiaceae bacterium]